jgi:hypothetical protein
MELYNWMWRYPHSETTNDLYRRAAKTAKFGCHLQDEVLVRLGAVIPQHHSRKHYGKAAQEFISWMTKITVI